MNLRHEPMGPDFDKYHVEGLPFPMVFHHFRAPDRGDPHDHPWDFDSEVLHGGYLEEVFNPYRGTSWTQMRRPGDRFHVPAGHIHRLVDLPAGDCWTVIRPQGDAVRKSGFYQFRDGVAWHRFWDEQEFRLMSSAPKEATS